MTFPSNIHFAYLYRDVGNYKQYGEVIFSNETSVSVEDIEQQIRAHLSDGLFLIARQVQLEERFFDVVNEDDHPWHEFVQVEATTDPTFDPVPAQKRDITQFQKELEQAHRSGWDEMQVREDLIRQIEKEREDLKTWLDARSDESPIPGEVKGALKSGTQLQNHLSDVKLQEGDEHENRI